MTKLDKMIKHLIAVLAIGLIASSPSFGQDDKPEKEPEKPAAAKKQEEPEEKEDEKDEESEEKDEETDDKKEKKKNGRSISDIVEEHDYLDGLFKLYRDPKTGAINMEVRADQLGKEFIYYAHITDGVVEGGHFRGQFRSQKVFVIEKRFDKLVLTEKNPFFYFDPENNLSKAEQANISDAVISLHKIRATDEVDEVETAYLINVDGLFKNETFEQIRPSNRPGVQPGQFFSLGKLNRGKTQISDVRNYPENTAVTVDYVYSNPSPVNRGNWFDITDARNVTVSVQHTLVAMPENDYVPRFDDSRIGYFLDYVNDQTSQSATPWRDLINRWHLVKKDPDAAVSDPVEPIVWWIENTTPEELRPIIKEAAEAWNPAFEQAGFSNAIVVKTQPDDAVWDAGDIRYNVLRWTSSPQPPFGGYGPSFSNPRTGQILAADIMLEYSFLTNRLNQRNVFETAALPALNGKAEIAPLAAEENASVAGFFERLAHHEHNCSLGAHLQLNTLVGKALAAVHNQSADVSSRMVKESIYYLILHEVGHTLGLNHNMKGTYARSYKTVYDQSAQEDGLSGSVMDYPAINFAPPGEEQAHFYPVTPGPYDIWAIQFGYDPRMDDIDFREAHLSRSTEKGLGFANDADDMRSPGRGIDPRVNIFDMSDDAVQFAKDRLQLADDALGKLQDKFIKDGESYQELRNAYLLLTGDMLWQGRVASRYIGGVYVDTARAGQNDADVPYRPVERAKQKQAMKLLRDYIFGPDAFKASPQLLQRIAIQHRGFLHGGRTEDPKIHLRVAIIQADILNHILHPVTLQRITDSTLYGNEYDATNVFSDLTDAIFEDDSRAAVNSHRQYLQTMYVRGLIYIMQTPFYDYVARSNAFASLRRIRTSMARWRGNAATRAHRDHIAFIVDKALEVVDG